jgi:hypothetical protein
MDAVAGVTVVVFVFATGLGDACFNGVFGDLVVFAGDLDFLVDVFFRAGAAFFAEVVLFLSLMVTFFFAVDVDVFVLEDGVEAAFAAVLAFERVIEEGDVKREGGRVGFVSGDGARIALSSSPLISSNIASVAIAVGIANSSSSELSSSDSMDLQNELYRAARLDVLRLRERDLLRSSSSTRDFERRYPSSARSPRP